MGALWLGLGFLDFSFNIWVAKLPVVFNPRKEYLDLVFSKTLLVFQRHEQEETQLV